MTDNTLTIGEACTRHLCEKVRELRLHLVSEIERRNDGDNSCHHQD